MEWTMTAGISVAASVICLVVAGLIWTVGQQHTPRVVVALVLSGAVGLMGTPFGRWVHDVVSWFDHQTGAIIGKFTGTVVFGIVFLVVVYILCVHVWKRRIGLTTLFYALTAPPAAAIVPGMVGVAALWIFTAIASIVGWPIAYLFALA